MDWIPQADTAPTGPPSPTQENGSAQVIHNGVRSNSVLLVVVLGGSYFVRGTPARPDKIDSIRCDCSDYEPRPSRWLPTNSRRGLGFGCWTAQVCGCRRSSPMRNDPTWRKFRNHRLAVGQHRQVQVQQSQSQKDHRRSPLALFRRDNCPPGASWASPILHPVWRRGRSANKWRRCVDSRLETAC